jgi:hypothetical protein
MDKTNAQVALELALKTYPTTNAKPRDYELKNIYKWADEFLAWLEDKEPSIPKIARQMKPQDRPYVQPDGPQDRV